MYRHCRLSETAEPRERFLVLSLLPALSFIGYTANRSTIRYILEAKRQVGTGKRAAGSAEAGALGHSNVKGVHEEADGLAVGTAEVLDSPLAPI